jgi:hypothetical protein
MVRRSELGWFHDFCNAKGAIWDHPGEVLELPVFVVMQSSLNPLTVDALSAIVDALNARMLLYDYENGPNSNTYIKLFLDRISLPIATPGGDLLLKGWDWPR